MLRLKIIQTGRARIIRDEMDEVHRALPKLKGREKDLRTEIFNTTRKKCDALKKR